MSATLNRACDVNDFWTASIWILHILKLGMNEIFKPNPHITLSIMSELLSFITNANVNVLFDLNSAEELRLSSLLLFALNWKLNRDDDPKKCLGAPFTILMRFHRLSIRKDTTTQSEWRRSKNKQSNELNSNRSFHCHLSSRKKEEEKN